MTGTHRIADPVQGAARSNGKFRGFFTSKAGWSQTPERCRVSPQW